MDFEKQKNPLETDVIIIDEMSMVDLNLMHALFISSYSGNKTYSCGRCGSASVRGTGKCVKRYHTFRKISRSDAYKDFSSGRRVIL